MNIARWMVGLALTALLLALAARAVEQVLRTSGRPTRWIWVAALGASVLLPLVGWWTDGAFPGGLLRLSGPSFDVSALIASAAAGGAVGVGIVTDSDAVSATGSVRVARALAGAWLVGSVVFALLYTGTWVRLARFRRGWREADIEGTAVLVSRADGPAVVGLLDPAIVVPAWLLDTDASTRALVVRHEREHVCARDHVLLALAPLAALAMPWNPALWWQLRRLRLAVELDCDRRVLASGIEPATYGALLLEIAGRSGRSLAGAAALAEPRTFLERRILAMSRQPSRLHLPHAVVFCAAAAILVLLACEAAAPTNVEKPQPSHAAEPETPSPIDDAPAAAETAPLVYIDGVLVGGEDTSDSILRRLDPADIERVEVLKGAAAAAYDAEGVILITTKAGARKSEAAAVRERATVEALKRLREERARAEQRSVRLRKSADAATATKTRERLSSFGSELLNDAVVYVDGARVTDQPTLDNLSPSNIESIEVLKGPAARALGVTDGKAVIRIETKR